MPFLNYGGCRPFGFKGADVGFRSGARGRARRTTETCVPHPFSVDSVATRDNTPLVTTADLPRLAVLKRILNRVRALLNEVRLAPYMEARYTAVPFWKPWRDY